MRLENMKRSIPETPDFIHKIIQSEVEKQLQDTEAANTRTRRVKKWTGVRITAAAAAVCVFAASTVAYAGVKLYHMYLEKQGAYGVATGIKPDGVVEEINLPEKIHDIDITPEYIPEGMEWADESHLEYPEHNRRGGFSFASVLLDNDDLDKVMQDGNVVECEEKTFGNYEGVYLRYHDFAEDGSFNQRIYLLCPEKHRVIIIYVGDDVTKEDAVKVAENLVVTENDAMIETAGMYTWSEEVSPEVEYVTEEISSVEDNNLPVYQIGDTFDLPVSGEDSRGRYITEKRISVCVDSVEAADDLRLLGGDELPEGWADAVGPDGKLVNNTLSYIKSGDGIDSLDEVVKTEEVKQKLVYATVTYTNNSDEDINHMLYLGALTLMEHENGVYRIYDPEEHSGDGYDRIIWDGAARTAEMTYRSVSEYYGNGGNYIPSLKPGESVSVNMAWIVNENDLDKMYLNLNGDGAAYSFSDSMLKTGIVDIRK